MVNFEALSHCVDQGDFESFLRLYIKQILDGDALPLPTEFEYDSLKLEWSDIISAVSSEASTLFIDQVISYWLLLLFHLETFDSDTFVQSLYAFLCQGKQLTISSLAKTDFQRQLMPSLKRRKSISLTGLKVTISASYDREISSEHDALFQSAKEALLVGDVDRFLQAHLLTVEDKVQSQLPVASVLDMIKERWIVILNIYGESYSDNFLEDLVSRWFFLVNLFGIPSTHEGVDRYYRYLLENPL